jgi:hypothetical protein
MATHHWRVVAELAAAQHGVVTRAQAAARGLDHRHVRALVARGVVDEVLPGVLRDRGAPVTWEQRVLAAVLLTGGVACGRTAAALHRLEGFLRCGPIEVLVERGRQRTVPGVTIRRCADLPRQRDVTAVDGIPCTSIARTLCELGRTCNDDQVERALDDALRRGCSLRWITETLDRLHRPGPAGTGALARVLARPDRSGAIPGSWRERTTARMLVHPELAGLVAQHSIRNARGEELARPDLALVEIRLGIEFHSDQWHFGPRRGRGDRRRDRRAMVAGWELMYLDAHDHRTPRAALDEVLDVVRARRAFYFPRTGEPGDGKAS